MTPSTKTLVGAVIAAVLAIAVYYGAISQQSATSIQSQANQAMGTAPQQTPASTQTAAPQAPIPSTAPAAHAPQPPR